MSDWDEQDRWVDRYDAERDNYAEWLEARELERVDTLAERGGEHKPLGSTSTAERSTSLVKSGAA